LFSESVSKKKLFWIVMIIKGIYVMIIFNTYSFGHKDIKIKSN
jgi:hypothetical protein